MRQGDLSEFAHFQRTTQGNPGFNINAFKRWYLGYGETGPYFQLEAYMRNILNHPNRGGPSSTNITSPAFGQFRLGGARNIQIRLRIGL